MFNPQQATVNRVLRVSGFDLETGKNIFTSDDIQNPSWENTEETENKTNALGAIAATFGRAKGSTFNAESTYMTFPLMAAQMGSEVQVASSVNKILAPAFEVKVIGAGAGGAVNTSITLSKTPAADPAFIYLLNSDSSIQKVFEKASAASATAFAIEDDEITLPTGATLLATDKIAVWYDYEAENAIKVVNGAENFPEVMKVDVEVLFADRCNQNVVYHGHIVYPKARPDGNLTLTPTTEGTHPFGFVAQADVCSDGKDLCYIVIPQ